MKEEINIQLEVQKIHATEKANYEIQLLCERYSEKQIEKAKILLIVESN
jgi:hypothetical protein